MTEITNVPGIGEVPVNHWEYTSEKLVNDYTRLMKDIQEIYSKSVITEEDYTKLQKALEDLKSLSQNGVVENGRTFYFSPDMIKKMSLAVSLLDAVGIDASGFTFEEFKTGLKILKDKDADIDKGRATGIKFSTILEGASGDLSAEWKTLQGMLYSDFIQEADSVYQAKLEKLKEQLEINKKVADILAKLLETQNKWTSAPDPSQYGTVSGDKPIAPKITVPPGDGMALFEYREKLKALLEELKQAGADPNVDGSLAQSLQKVLNDLNAVLKNADDFKPVEPTKYDEHWDWEEMNRNAYLKVVDRAAATWAMDGRDQIGGNAGSFQDNISKAITASEALNDTQKEELRSIQLVYEQFVKLATSLMQTLTKMIEKFAQGAGR